MSALARALTQAGYAVLSFDFRGHGSNRNPFTRRGGHRESLVADMRAAVDFLRLSQLVDGARVSVMGHSMGAHAALEYAGIDPALDATVLISGGARLDGPQRPANALFIYAAGDPERMRVRAAGLAAQLAGADEARIGTVYGSFRDATAVSHVEVARADHITILGSGYAARQIIDWLDQSYGVERGTFFLRDDARMPAAGIGLLAFVLLLPGLGAFVGRLAPRSAERDAGGLPARAGLLLLGLVGTLPLVAASGLEQFVPFWIGDFVVLHFFAAGVAVAAFGASHSRFDGAELRDSLRRSLVPAGVALVAVVFLFSPFTPPLHAMGLTPERTAGALVIALLVLPLQVVFHDLLRRGSFAAATVASSLGRIAVLAVLVLAVQLGVLHGVVMLMLPVLALLFVLFEILAASIYAASRNVRVPALVESAWMAWFFAATLPVTV